MALWLVGLVTGFLVDAAVCSVICLLVSVFHDISKYCVTICCGTWSLSSLNFTWFTATIYYVSEYVFAYVFVFVSARVFTYKNKLGLLILLLA